MADHIFSEVCASGKMKNFGKKDLLTIRKGEKEKGLLDAVAKGHMNVVKFLWENGVQSPIALANATSLRMVKYLVENGADLTLSTLPAEFASMNDHMDIFDFLIDSGAEYP